MKKFYKPFIISIYCIFPSAISMDFLQLSDCGYKTSIEQLLRQRTKKDIIENISVKHFKQDKQASAKLASRLKIWIDLKNQIENRKDFSKELHKIKNEFLDDPILIEKIEKILPKRIFKESTNYILNFFYNILAKLIYIRPNNEKLSEIAEYIISSNLIN